MTPQGNDPLGGDLAIPAELAARIDGIADYLLDEGDTYGAAADQRGLATELRGPREAVSWHGRPRR